MVNIKINGIPVQVEEGTTILDAAKKVNINIPILCYNPDLPPWGSCGICIVKIGDSPRLVRACTTPIDGMMEGKNIITHDADIITTRKIVLELILSNHPDDCLQCPRNLSCTLSKTTSA